MISHWNSSGVEDEAVFEVTRSGAKAAFYLSLSQFKSIHAVLLSCQPYTPGTQHSKINIPPRS